MSEFQYYEFVAIDRALSVAEQKRLRAITSRATITSTRLVNTYEWGDFKADPHTLVAKYFDAFLYYANWGTRRLILSVPSSRLDPGLQSNTAPFAPPGAAAVEVPRLLHQQEKGS
jgi:hypothetical protein